MKPTHDRKRNVTQMLKTPALLLCLAIAGCSTDQQADQPATPAATPGDTGQAMPAIPAVALWPNMTSIDARPVFPMTRDKSSGRLIAEVEVESLVSRVLNVQYRINWLDSQGRSLTPDARFKILNLPIGATQKITETDPTGNATNWRAEFRPAESGRSAYGPRM